jgi:hypothetical protein
MRCHNKQLAQHTAVTHNLAVKTVKDCRCSAHQVSSTHKKSKSMLIEQNPANAFSVYSGASTSATCSNAKRTCTSKNKAGDYRTPAMLCEGLLLEAAVPNGTDLFASTALRRYTTVTEGRFGARQKTSKPFSPRR